MWVLCALVGMLLHCTHCMCFYSSKKSDTLSEETCSAAHYKHSHLASESATVRSRPAEGSKLCHQKHKELNKIKANITLYNKSLSIFFFKSPV